MYDILEQLCNERGVAITKLCKDVTGSSGNLSTWKKGYMRSDYLKKVAEILNVSADYLLGRTEQKNASMNNGSVINSGSNNNIQNGNNIINSNNNNITQSAPIENDDVWATYSKLSTKDKLEVQLDILNRGHK